MEAQEAQQHGNQRAIGQNRPLPTPRARLHENIKRLRSLDRQLFWDQLNQAELLTAIELVGFKVQHLARQIQEAEELRAPPACRSPERAAETPLFQHESVADPDLR